MRRAPEPQAVHRLRVAIRRTRSALRTFRDVLPESLDFGLGSELRTLARALGELRDLDVYRERHAARRASLSEQDRAALSRHERGIEAERQRAAARLAEILDRASCVELLEELRADAGKQGSVKALRKTAARRRARAYLEPARKSVLKRGGRIDAQSPPERLHALRIRIKRFRYLLEFLLPLYESEADAALRAAIRAQDVLGAYQDACTAVARLRRYAADAPDDGNLRPELLALGALVALERMAASKARKRFVKEWPALEKTFAALALED